MRKYVKHLILVVGLCLSVSAQALVAHSFVVQSIRVEGAQRISHATILNYVPVRAGQRLELAQSNQIIRSLYETGFFSQVNLVRRGETLIVRVAERPTIGDIVIDGNKLIKTDDLNVVLKSMGVVKGRVYDQSIVDGVRRALIQQYHFRGNYKAHVEAEIHPLSDNRVAITIQIYEGKEARIRQIRIVGNHVFKEKSLLKLLQLRPTGMLSFFRQDDRFSNEKFQADLDALRTFYMDHGYLQFEILQSQVAITPDKQDVRITIHIKEGEQFMLKGYEITGELLDYAQELEHLVHLHPGAIFSRADVRETSMLIGKFLGDRGYAHAKITPVPVIDEAKREVFIRIVVEPGRLVYVRRILFSGNLKTNEEVLRREMVQFEGSLLSTARLDESMRQLRLLKFFKQVDSHPVPVPDDPDQVDLLVDVKEEPTAHVNLGLGFSTDTKISGNIAYEETNFLGTGQTLNVGFGRSAGSMQFNIMHMNPYFTDSGITRTFSLFAKRVDAEKVYIANYAISNYGGTLGFGIPLSLNDILRLSVGYTYIDLSVGSTATFIMSRFRADHGSRFNEVAFNIDWTHNGLDRGIFPTHGTHQNAYITVGVPVFSDSLDYFKAGYTGIWYQPLWHHFIMVLRGEVGYGTGYNRFSDLPFFKNYYAGGIRSVRGYRTNSLGPKGYELNGVVTSDLEPTGGNLLVLGRASLILPQWYDSLRTSLFVDAGNVFNAGTDIVPVSPNRFDWDKFRYSLGVAFHWRSPMGPLLISFARAMNPGTREHRQVFQFSVDTGI